MTTTSVGSKASEVPRYVLWAVVAAVINGIGGVVYSITAPDVDDRGTVVVVSIVIALVLLVSSWLVWRGLRWGGFAFIASNVFNALLAIPAYFADVDGAFLVGATVSIILSAISIVAVVMPDARTWWTRRG